uniref:Uncharacterized protein n=1 Tax=viral metagenome TaxID=1070528 RepID=A0A6C0IH84_9ZZZZ
MMDVTLLTKKELKELLITYQAEINKIDEKSIYSLSYYYYDEGSKRHQIVDLMKDIRNEIIYREDDEKREKYRSMRERDPLKYGKKRLLLLLRK